MSEQHIHGPGCDHDDVSGCTHTPECCTSIGCEGRRQNERIKELEIALRKAPSEQDVTSGPEGWGRYIYWYREIRAKALGESAIQEQSELNVSKLCNNCATERALGVDHNCLGLIREGVICGCTEEAECFIAQTKAKLNSNQTGHGTSSVQWG